MGTHFNMLSLIDKALLINEFGMYIYSIEWYRSHWCHLYSINTKFVEVYYNTSTRQIDAIIMIDYKELDKYMSKICLILPFKVQK